MNHFNEIEVEVTEQDREVFEIRDLPTLGWAFRKIGALQVKQDEIDTYAKAEIEKIKEWQNSEIGKLSNNVDFFLSHIERYHFHKLMEDPKAKTLSTPYGESKSRLSKPTPEKVDDAILLEYIQQNDMREYVKETADWGKLKKTLTVFEIDGGFIAVDENGEQVPGVIIKPESTTFSFEVNK